MAGARQLVDAPGFTPLPYGLWEAAQKPAAPGTHWQQGVTWQDRCPTGGTTYDECIAVTGTGSPPAPAELSANVEQTLRGATPITVYAQFDCATVGLSDAERAASDALARVEQQQLERAFWTGASGGQDVAFPHLAAEAEVLDDQGVVLQTAASPVVTGGVDVAHGLGLLEQELADCYAGQGVIHVPRSALPTLTAWKLAREDGNGRLMTPGGNLIAVGGGYRGTGPDGAAAAAGTAWIYATGAVFGYRSQVTVHPARQSIDRSTNTYRMIAQRTYVLGWECCHLAAHVTLGVPT